MRFSLLFLALLLIAPVLARADDSFFTAKAYDRAEASRLLNEANGPAFFSFAADGYAEVRRSQLLVLHALYLRSLTKEGLPGAFRNSNGSGWDKRFNCFSMAWDFVSYASRRMSVEMRWRSWSSDVARPAMLVTCYCIGGNPKSGHAIVLVLTDEGPVYLDPQRGIVLLTPEEKQTIYYPQG